MGLNIAISTVTLQEVEKLEQRIAKAQQAQVKCGDNGKEKLETEKQRYNSVLGLVHHLQIPRLLS